MKELGIDTLNKRKLIIARERKNRPVDKVETSNILESENYNKSCPFCRGNEKFLEKETFRIEDDNNWIVKSVMNKYPIIDDNDVNEIKGVHEVIIDTYKHDGNFFNMTEDEFYYLLLAYKDRFKALKELEDTKYICLFKNYLRPSGATLMHSHSQILSLPFIPLDLENEYKVCEEFYEEKNINMYDYIIEEEIKYKNRIIHNSEDFFVFIPEVCRYTGDTVILFKENIYFDEIEESELKKLSKIMKKLFEKMYDVYGNCPFNIYLHSHPVNTQEDYKDKFKWHIHVLPRRSNFGGFELSTGLYVSSRKSEDIAQKLKFD